MLERDATVWGWFGWVADSASRNRSRIVESDRKLICLCLIGTEQVGEKLSKDFSFNVFYKYYRLWLDARLQASGVVRLGRLLFIEPNLIELN